MLLTCSMMHSRSSSPAAAAVVIVVVVVVVVISLSLSLKYLLPTELCDNHSGHLRTHIFIIFTL